MSKVDEEMFKVDVFIKIELDSKKVDSNDSVTSDGLCLYITKAHSISYFLVCLLLHNCASLNTVS